MLKKFSFALVLLVLVSAPGWCEIVDRIMAVVNNEVITGSMVVDAMNAIWADPGTLPKSQEEALQKLIDHKLKLQEARRLGITVSEEELSNEITKVTSRFPSKEEFLEALMRRGITQEDLQSYLIEEVMVLKVVERNFGFFIKPADLEAEALDFFEQNKEKFIIPESVRIDQIFFKLDPDADEKTKESVKEKAKDVMDKLKEGEAFEEYTKIEGKNEYVTVDQLIPIISATVSKLKVGEVSDLIETPVGYFIVRLNDRRPARQATFDEVRDELFTHIRRQRIDTELSAWLKKQRETADIRILGERRIDH